VFGKDHLLSGIGVPCSPHSGHGALLLEDLYGLAGAGDGGDDLFELRLFHHLPHLQELLQ
jgi:hypothetical protein